MPIIPSDKQSFLDPLAPQLYSEVILGDTEWSDVAGLGAPEDSANVTGEHLFLSNTQPSPIDADEGDIWYDSSDDNHAYKLVAGVWVSIRDTGAASPSGPDIGQWVNNLVFSATDYRIVAWGAGTITLKDGTAYSITASNTGNMAAITYIYLDTDVSLTALQTTTTAATAVGTDKLLVAVAKPNAVTTKDAEFQVFGGFGQSSFISADNIAANSITANEIVANSITANRLSISQLSAISADVGTITAGTITGATIRTAASGSRFVMTSSTFQGFNAAGDVIFEVILTGADEGDVIMGDDASGTYLQWDNSAGELKLNGTLIRAGGDALSNPTFNITTVFSQDSGGSINSCGFSDASPAQIAIGSWGSNDEVWASVIALSPDIGAGPYIKTSGVQAGATTLGSTDTDVIAIGNDIWTNNTADGNLYKNNSAASFSGTARNGPMGVDVTNSNMLILYSSTKIAMFSGIAGTTLTNLNTDVTLDTAVSIKGFVFDDANNQYVCVDLTNNLLRKFDSAGTTIETVAYTVDDGNVKGVALKDGAYYLVISVAHSAASFTSQMISLVPTSMLRG